MTPEYIDISDTIIWDTGIYWYIGHYIKRHRNILIFRTLQYGTLEYIDISDTIIWDTGIYWYIRHFNMGHWNILIFRTLLYGTLKYFDISDTSIWDTEIFWYFGHFITWHWNILIFRTLYYVTPELSIISKPSLPQLNFTGHNDVTTKAIFYWESMFCQYLKMEIQLKLKLVNVLNKLVNSVYYLNLPLILV